MVRVIFGCLSLCYLIAFLFSHYAGYLSMFGTGSGMAYIFPAILGAPWSFLSMFFLDLVWGPGPPTGRMQAMLWFFLILVMPGLINLQILLIPVVVHGSRRAHLASSGFSEDF